MASVSPTHNHTLSAPEGTEHQHSVAKESNMHRNLELPKRTARGESDLEPPVEAYEGFEKVPEEFLMKGKFGGEFDLLTSQQRLAHLNAHVEPPVIDLSPLMISSDSGEGASREAAMKVKQEIGRASAEWGVFQVVNHGMSESLLTRVLAVAREFFHLPLEEKRKCSQIPGVGGTQGYGRLDYKHLFRAWGDNLRYTIRPKPHMNEDRMPNNPPDYRKIMEEYNEGVERVLDVIWLSLSEYLGLEAATLKKAQEESSRLSMRLNYYPKCPEPSKVAGVAAHKDFGSLTVLLQDEVGGLQAELPKDKIPPEVRSLKAPVLEDQIWVDVKPQKGALVINIANQVEILSNGRFRSALHRAYVHQNSRRLTIVTFASPGMECTIEPVKEILDKTQELPRYKPLVYKDYYSNLEEDLKAGLVPHARYEINR